MTPAKSHSTIIFGFVVILSLASSTKLLSQEIYTSSWTVQDPKNDIRHEFVAAIIEKLNMWVTRDNPEAQTARIDDRVKIEIKGVFDEVNGSILPHLIRIQAGDVDIEGNPYNFLDSATVDTLIRRDYYWSDERVNVLDITQVPDYYQNVDTRIYDSLPTYESTFFRSQKSPLLSLDRSIIPFNRKASVIFGFGQPLLNLPLFSYGRGIVGVESQNISAWYEIPLEMPGPEFLSRTDNTPSHGIGLSFSLPYAGGMLTLSNLIPTSINIEDSALLLTKSVLLFGEVPIGFSRTFGGYLRLQGGLALLEASTLYEETDHEVPLVRSRLYPREYLRFEVRSIDQRGKLNRSLSIDLVGLAIGSRVTQRISKGFLFSGGFVIRELLSDPLPYEAPFTFWLTPIIEF